MKKFCKIMGIISAVLAVAGIIFIIIGVKSGGADVIAGRVANNELPFIHFDIDDFDTEGMESLSDENTFTKDEVQSIELKGKYGKYQFCQGTNDNLSVSVTNGSSKVKYSLENGILKIIDNGNKKFWSTEKTCQIKIYIPTDYKLNNVNIKVGAGIVGGSYISNGTLDIDVGAGKGNFDSIMADNYNISIGAGEAEINSSRLGNGNIEVGMGDFDFTGTISGNTDIQCGMGDVSLELQNHYSDFNYVLNVGAGDIEINDEDYSGISYSKNINNSAAFNMNIDCGMGNVSVENIE